ncbi:MAG: carbohydrate ABC transporter permease [Candidatus Latescibacteria bacterium]|nr:carbohydrate ABC transporter permease [Candidatus Latescibacterota bacterium]
MKQIIPHIVLGIGALVFFFPFAWLVSTSLKPDHQIFVFPPVLFPHPVRWENFRLVFEYIPFFRLIGNTVLVTGLNITGTLLSCSLVAYSFARLRWPGRDTLFVVMLSTMMLPAQVTMIPIYLLFARLGWVDTFKPLWVPSLFGSAFHIFLLRQFLLTIPRELEEAALVDGAGYFNIYRTIMLPLIKPALATVAIFTFMANWNDFLHPLIYLNSLDRMTLAIGLRLLQATHGSEWGLLMAASTMMTVPVVIVFFFTQRYFIQGITLTGLKG